MKRKESNIDAVREMYNNFLNLPIEDTAMSPLIVSHPVFESGITMSRNGDMLNIYESKDDLQRAIKELFDISSNFKKVEDFFALIRKPYKLTFLMYCRDYLTNEDFSSLLGDIWVTVENGNQDVNVSVGTISRWFSSADKNFLMDEGERAYIESLPEEFEIYRGVGEGRNPKGLSWTRDLNLAKWFANRWNKNGYVIKGKAKKRDVLAYFGNRAGSSDIGETEIVIQYSKVMDKEKIEA